MKLFILHGNIFQILSSSGTIIFLDAIWFSIVRALCEKRKFCFVEVDMQGDMSFRIAQSALAKVLSIFPYTFLRRLMPDASAIFHHVFRYIFSL